MMNQPEQRRRVVRILAAAVIAGVVVYVVTEVVSWVAFFGFKNISPNPGSWLGWTQGISRIAYDVWVGALALLILMWVWARLTSDAETRP